MARGKKRYNSGDQMHFIVTEDFVEFANAFKEYCEANSINTSSAIRDAMVQWLRERTARDVYMRHMDDSKSMKMLAEMYEKDVLREV